MSSPLRATRATRPPREITEVLLSWRCPPPNPRCIPAASCRSVQCRRRARPPRGPRSRTGSTGRVRCPRRRTGHPSTAPHLSAPGRGIPRWVGSRPGRIPAVSLSCAASSWSSVSGSWSSPSGSSSCSAGPRPAGARTAPLQARATAPVPRRVPGRARPSRRRSSARRARRRRRRVRGGSGSRLDLRRRTESVNVGGITVRHRTRECAHQLHQLHGLHGLVHRVRSAHEHREAAPTGRPTSVQQPSVM